VFFLREFELVFGDEEMVVHTGEGVLDQCVVFLRAEQQTDGWVVALAIAKLQ